MATMKTWSEIITMPLGLMARVPLEPIAGLLVPVVTNFKAQFGTYSVDLLIRNLDLVNPLTYQLNTPAGAGAAMGLAAGGEIGLNNVLTESVIIVGNVATGTWQMLPFALPRELLYK